MTGHAAPDPTIGTYLLGLESPSDRLRFRTHLVECEVCRVAWADLRHLPPLLACAAAVQAPRPGLEQATIGPDALAWAARCTRQVDGSD